MILEHSPGHVTPDQYRTVDWVLAVKSRLSTVARYSLYGQPLSNKHGAAKEIEITHSKVTGSRTRWHAKKTGIVHGSEVTPALYFGTVAAHCGWVRSSKREYWYRRQCIVTIAHQETVDHVAVHVGMRFPDALPLLSGAFGGEYCH
jgi:hypothetical protein